MINLDSILKGDRRSLGKAITLIESTKENDRIIAQDLLEKILPHSGKSFRVGITGVPGVGKSSFIEAFGLYLIKKGHRVAVLAVDPSSPINGGSIMGDKTRMEELSHHQNAFIRPSPASGSLGGVAEKTRESILLCEAAGYDYILVETVGVGQSEYEVSSMVDFFMLLMLPNAGDELQGIKKGILELASAIIINKADGDTLEMAQLSLAHYKSALELFSHGPLWKTEVLTCSALQNKNIDLIYNMLNSFKVSMGEKNIFENRKKQNKEWFFKLTTELLLLKSTSNKLLVKKKSELEEQVGRGEKTPFVAAREFVSLI